MSRNLLIASLFLVVVATVHADDKQSKPKGPPPLKGVARLTDGVIRVYVTTFEVVPEERTVKKKVNGMEVIEKVTVQVPVARTVTRQYKSSDVQVLGKDGKKIDPKDVARLLEKETPLLLSADGKPVDPSYLTKAGERTLVLIETQRPSR
jgi:hypothetical protein